MTPLRKAKYGQVASLGLVIYTNCVRNRVYRIDVVHDKFSNDLTDVYRTDVKEEQKYSVARTSENAVCEL